MCFSKWLKMTHFSHPGKKYNRSCLLSLENNSRHANEGARYTFGFESLKMFTWISGETQQICYWREKLEVRLSFWFRLVKLTTMKLSVKMEALAFMSIVYSVLSFFTTSTKLGKNLMVKEKRLNIYTVLILQYLGISYT